MYEGHRKRIAGSGSPESGKLRPDSRQSHRIYVRSVPDHRHTRAGELQPVL